MSDLKKYGTYEYVSIPYLLAGVKMRLGLRDTSDNDIYLTDLLNEGARELRNLGVQIPAIATLPIENKKAKLPKGFMRFTKKYPIRYVSDGGTAPTNGALVPEFINNAFFQGDPNDLATIYGGTVNIVDGYLYFSSDVDSPYCKISYLSANVDVNGNIRVPSYCQRALQAYASWNFRRTYPVDAYSMQSWEREWINGKEHCRAISKMPDSLEYDFINDIYNALV